MSEPCTRCHVEPRYGISPLCASCLWPARRADLEQRASEEMREVEGLEQWLTSGIGNPLQQAWPEKRKTGAAILERAVAKRFPTSPLGRTDAGIRSAPKPHGRRIGNWWCFRTDRHADSECRTPATREIARSDFGPASATRRRF